MTLLALGAGFSAGPVRGAEPPSTGVRTEIVLKVGPVEISRYLVEKNLARLQRAASGGRGPAGATARGLEMYLVRQVITAEALHQGYARRPEVVGMVETMERHMLAQAESPVAPPTEEELQAAYQRAEPPSGRIKPPFAEMRPMLEKRLALDRRSANRQAKRSLALQAVELVIHPDILDKLFQRLQAAGPQPATEIGEELVRPLAGEPLATYRLAGQTVTLTAEDWRRRFNQLFVREIPTNLAQLDAGIQDLAVADYAVQQSRKQGLDREPQFVEDRRNFHYFQALDLFEKERLRPQVEATAAEAEAYYRAHPGDFARPVRARGRLLHFPDAAAALAWFPHREADPAAGEEIEVSAQLPLPGAAGATDYILRLADGEPSGPINVATGVIVFLKRSAVTEPEPYAAVAARIRAKLTQPKLEALEAGLAREWASRYVIEDHLHPAEFGEAGRVEKPWSGQTEAAGQGPGQK